VSVRQKKNGTIMLEGHCPVEDAELLLQLLQAAPDNPLDWTHCTHLHTAVLQVIMAACPVRIGPCGDPWVGRWVRTEPLQASKYP
jgi:hypothetical protein